MGTVRRLQPGALVRMRALCVLRRRHWIDTALVPGMTPGQTPQRQVTALEHAVGSNSLLSIRRAAWIKTAVVAKERADNDFVAAN